MTPVCKEIRKDILGISKASGHGHIPTCFSVVEIIYAAYDFMSHDPKNPSLKSRDIFVLSKGHAALAHYCVLSRCGYFGIDEVYSFGSFMSRFGCHADRLKVPGIEVSTGSLGHGIGVAVGIAIAFKIRREARRVFVVIGDGESNEGTVWEAVMVAVNLKLNNLIIIYDNNQSHARGLQIQDPTAHFRGFGCAVSETDGHDIGLIQKELGRDSDTVKVIIANTIKGYGCSTLIENQYEWHRKSPNEAEYEILTKELDAETV
ncbi:MAG: transketolase [Thermodesulfovibrio sp.]|nr:transketolase [Thermodesulfovibrio sp.]